VDDTGFRRGAALMRRHLEDDRRPGEFTLLGRTWELLDGVFSPTYTPVTALFSGWLPYPVGGTFLEVGSGAGVTSVVAAQAGCAAVTALDISSAAVENTRRNAARHGVGDRVRVLHSDLFAALDPDERFDLIYWNSNFAEAPRDFVNATDLHHAFFDPRYDAHRRFVREAPARLTDSGRLLLGFSTIGNTDLLAEICAEAGLTVEVSRSERHRVDADTVLEFQLLELRRAGGVERSPRSARDRPKGSTVPDNAGMQHYLSLLAQRQRGVLATLKADGRPQLSTIDFAYHGPSRTIRLSTTDDRAKIRNLRRDPRVSLHVSTPGGGAYAVYEGVAELSSVAADPHDDAVEELVQVYRDVQGEHPDWDDYRAAMVADRRLVVRFRVDRAYGWIPS
jgi:release factor glutamine methyltransferase